MLGIKANFYEFLEMLSLVINYVNSIKNNKCYYQAI